MTKVFLSPSIEKYVRENYLKAGSFEKLKDSINKKFNTSFSYDKIKRWCNWRGLKMGRNGEKNGNHYKGLSEGSEHMEPRDGYIMIKTNEGWKYKHVFIWEKENGKIPADHCLIFLDGDRSNCNLENLLLVERKISLYLGQQKLRFNDPELTRVAVGIAIQKFGIVKKLKSIYGDNREHEKHLRRLLKGEK
jgi:hypothetical protein